MKKTLYIQIIATILLFIPCAFAAVINFSVTTPLQSNTFIGTQDPNQYVSFLPYTTIIADNGSGVYDTINNNGTIYVRIVDGYGQIRNYTTLQINVTADNTWSIEEKMQQLAWNQFVLDAGGPRNAMLYYVKHWFYHNEACWSRY